jgi:hypothetical protein
MFISFFTQQAKLVRCLGGIGGIVDIVEDPLWKMKQYAPLFHRRFPKMEPPCLQLLPPFLQLLPSPHSLLPPYSSHPSLLP